MTKLNKSNNKKIADIKKLLRSKRKKNNYYM